MPNAIKICRSLQLRQIAVERNERELMVMHFPSAWLLS